MTYIHGATDGAVAKGGLADTTPGKEKAYPTMMTSDQV